MNKARAVVECGSKFDPDKPSRSWLETIKLTANAYIDLKPDRAGAELLASARGHAEQCQQAIEEGRAKSAAFHALAALQAVWCAEITEGLPMIRHGVRALRETERHNARQSAQAAVRYAHLQQQAASIWRKHPKWNASEVARHIDGRRWSTIRRHIRKPAPK